ncbi:MAG: hypothetical protein ACREXT_08475, partial [Gammaproteobacteria bacterium]
MRQPISVDFQGGKVFAIGGSIYRQARDGPYGLIDAIHDHAMAFFGEAFIDAEALKAIADRHPAVHWLLATVERDEKVAADKSDDPRARQTGAGAAWMRFAYDLFTIADNAELQKRLRQRLLSARDYQGARHELRVAAMCIAAGFALEFEDESDGSRTHPEFIAHDKQGVRIAVEAKSRHRHGVQGFSGGHAVDPGESVNTRKLVLESYRKKTDLPLYAFIDVNLPPRDEEGWLRWMHELNQLMADLSAEGYADQCAANAILFFNDPSHYVGDGRIGFDHDKLWLRHFEAQTPRKPHPAGVLERLLKAFAQRRAPPPNFPDFRAEAET